MPGEREGLLPDREIEARKEKMKGALVRILDEVEKNADLIINNAKEIGETGMWYFEIFEFKKNTNLYPSERKDPPTMSVWVEYSAITRPDESSNFGKKGFLHPHLSLHEPLSALSSHLIFTNIDSSAFVNFLVEQGVIPQEIEQAFKETLRALKSKK